MSWIQRSSHEFSSFFIEKYHLSSEHLARVSHDVSQQVEKSPDWMKLGVRALYTGTRVLKVVYPQVLSRPIPGVKTLVYFFESLFLFSYFSQGRS